MGSRSSISQIITIFHKLAKGFTIAVGLSCKFLLYKSKGKKTVVFQLNATNQLPHIENILERLCSPKYRNQFCCTILVGEKEIQGCLGFVKNKGFDLTVASYYATSFLLFWDILFAVDQRMRLPLVNILKGSRICIYHGQPSKGNVYIGYNHKYFDGLFFYGQMMKEYYFQEKACHPEWSAVQTWDVGQPKSDDLFTVQLDIPTEKEKLGFAKQRKTVLYAPSFEYCASMATHGREIISALRKININVIIKPHPSFYRAVDKNDVYFKGVPHVEEWREFVEDTETDDSLLFPLDGQTDTTLALQMADVLITDHSGIAFDAIIMDKPVIYFDCPRFFDEYLPEQFDVDGKQAREDITCNAGRSTGTVVKDVDELMEALNIYLMNPNLHEEKRQDVRNILLFNGGNATDFFVDTLVEITEGKHG